VAGTARRVDQDHMQFRELNITTYTEDNQIDLQIAMADSVLDLNTRVLSSPQRTTIKRADFEIAGDTARFDTAARLGTITGNVKVFDPRFNLQSDKLTVYLHKGEEQGLEKAIAEGNVGVVRDRPDPNGGPPTHAVGRSEHAVYTANDGSVELTGMPKVQQGLN